LPLISATHEAERARAQLREKEELCENYCQQLQSKQQQTQLELQKIRMEFQEKLLRATSQGNELNSSSDIWRRRLMDNKVG
jgi:chaperonin cofactor prefoldin